jgi:hypothetical protein
MAVNTRALCEFIIAETKLPSASVYAVERFYESMLSEWSDSNPEAHYTQMADRTGVPEDDVRRIFDAELMYLVKLGIAKPTVRTHQKAS